MRVPTKADLLRVAEERWEQCWRVPRGAYKWPDTPWPLASKSERRMATETAAAWYALLRPLFLKEAAHVQKRIARRSKP